MTVKSRRLKKQRIRLTKRRGGMGLGSSKMSVNEIEQKMANLKRVYDNLNELLKEHDTNIRMNKMELEQIDHQRLGSVKRNLIHDFDATIESTKGGMYPASQNYLQNSKKRSIDEMNYTTPMNPVSAPPRLAIPFTPIQNVKRNLMGEFDEVAKNKNGGMGLSFSKSKTKQYESMAPVVDNGKLTPPRSPFTHTYGVRTPINRELLPEFNKIARIKKGGKLTTPAELREIQRSLL